MSGAVPVTKENCPKCGYEMTKPFEWRCPNCVVYDDNVKLPVDPQALLGQADAAKK
ncbi:hypothetical protein TRFO_28938 [Tritrichomonas foetus]|uniref:Uncharacterized protein n=1 Tax=Tritrichomonas foetus TaxID=1144522 RepID=A0A1J4K2A3_9EUKA|nr:hypothetical protein TRFO_28938 [Tritrichomonas foetus]|eukprot:OHT03621.1 hypothetical protein TRFO_28938 [Tritrichomonas foetus]